MTTISKFRVMRNKDIQTLLGVTESTATKYLKDIKEELHCPKVLFCHFEAYFKIGANTEKTVKSSK